MSNEFTFSKATRVGIKPLIGLFGESNSGKTFSALLMARGIAGPTGKIVGIDTESNRMSLYANEVPGGFEVCDFVPPFSPKRYMQALDAAEALNPDVIVIDSFSHEWFGEGGVLDMASEKEASGTKGLAVWKQPKLEHAKLVSRLMRSSTFVIVCLRAKFKSRQVKHNGRTEIVKDDHVSPEQDESLLFEMTAHCEMQTSNPGTIRLTKWSVPDLAQCFPEDGKEKLGITHGGAIACWARGDAPKVRETQAPAIQDDLLMQISEATEASELDRYVSEANSITDNPERQKRLKSVINRKAKELGLKWQGNCFVSQQ